VIQHDNAFHLERQAGFLERAAERGLRVRTIHVSASFVLSSRSPGWLTRQLPSQGGPFGVMAAADYIAQWVEKACLTAALRIPDDVAIVGVDNNREICELASVPLSSIDNNAFLHGYEGARLLHAFMRGDRGARPPWIVPAGALHVRASTDHLATRHPHVAAALRLIAARHTDASLTADAVASHVPMSKRRLNDAFVRHTGRTISQEIVHRRIQHAIRRIQETNDKLWDVAAHAGFGSPEVMARVFHRKLGICPSRYRLPGSGRRV